MEHEDEVKNLKVQDGAGDYLGDTYMSSQLKEDDAHKLDSILSQSI